jgi:hypothetical protein
VAAVLCTIGAAITTTALVVLSISEPTTVNELAAIGAGIGTLGGLAWIIAAAIEIGRRPP